MNYSGKICDGCREPLENGDDIVVCPICGTPQHRSCYEKNHKCVNEYLHSTGFVWTDPDEEKKKSEPVSVQNETTQPAQDQPEKQPSFVQATPQNMESVFMRGVLYDPKDDIGKVRVSEAADFIQNSSPRYIHKYMKQKKSGRKLSWNWAAFFFSPFWFFYRKLYKAGAIFLTISVVLSLVNFPWEQRFIEQTAPLTSQLSEIVADKSSADSLTAEEKEKIKTISEQFMEIVEKNNNYLFIVSALIRIILPQVTAALLANYLLKRKMLRVVNLAHNATDDPELVKYTIMRNGGVSIIMPIIALTINAYLPDLLLNIAYKINF